MGFDILETLVKRSERFSYKKVHFYLFAKSGFTKGCIDRANEMGNVTIKRRRRDSNPRAGCPAN